MVSMRVKVRVEHEVEVEVNNPVVEELDNWYRTHENVYWKDVPEGLIEKADEAVVSAFMLTDFNYEDICGVITGVYAMDDEAILEY